MKAIFSFSFLFISIACGSPRQPVRVDTKPNSILASSAETGTLSTDGQADADSESNKENKRPGIRQGDANSALGQDLLLAPALKDPDLANAMFEQTRIVTSAEWGTQVPILKLKKQDADYVEILRCTAQHLLTLPDGRSLNTVTETELERVGVELLHWAWIEAAGNANVCRVVSRRFGGAEFQDIASPSGSYYYVSNPCVSESYLAPEKTSNCSFRLRISNTVQIASSFKDLLRDQVSANLEAQAEATGILAKLQYVAERIALNRELCEKGQIVEQRSANLWNGMVQLATLGLTSVVSSSLSAIPLIAALDGKKVANLAVSVFGKTPKLPASCTALEADFNTGKQLSEDYERAIEQIEESAKQLNTQINTIK